MSVEALPMLVVFGVFGFYAVLGMAARIIGWRIRRSIDCTKENK